MLGLHIDSKAIDMQHKIESANLSQASLFVYLPLIVRKNLTEQFKRELKEVPLLEEVQEILASDLLTSPEHYSLRGSFMELLQKWLDILYQFEVSKKHCDD